MKPFCVNCVETRTKSKAFGLFACFLLFAVLVGCSDRVDREIASREELESRHAALTIALLNARHENAKSTIQDAAARVSREYGDDFFKSAARPGAIIRFNTNSDCWADQTAHSNAVAVFLDKSLYIEALRSNVFPCETFNGDLLLLKSKPF